MGVPKFYRWLSERYPLINQLISASTLLPEIDNFYLDMNGIIHACSHPNDEDVSHKLTLREMILAIFRYIDRCVSDIVKPKKLLYLAIDGVAPRAKMNQQRSRRFRAGQERRENMEKALARGEPLDEDLFDSNCITPGTEFMEIIDKHLKYYIRKKMKDDPVWRDLEVIYSGHDVPGEGEHKILEHIRNARSQPDYLPNQRHCLYGQDADLIMLALGTHEPHFTLLREVVNFGRRPGQGARETIMRQTQQANFQLLHLSVLREYIELEFAFQHTGPPLDKERLIDDFIFMTFLVGNDFLPHLTSLDIGEHAFDTIFEAYKAIQKVSPGYLVENGELNNLVGLEFLFTIIGQQENSILQNREVEQKLFNAKRRKRVDPALLEDQDEQEEFLEQAFENALQEAMTTNEFKEEISGGEKDEVAVVEANKDSPKDYIGRYYFQKFRIIPGTEAAKCFIEDLTREYFKGMMWCLSYYMKGCVSWTWFYPYHYGPLLVDMKALDLKRNQISFDLGQPFKPFQQLLGCLPPVSKNLLPTPYQWLMTNPQSPIIEYYPEDFGIDMDGKRNPWEAVVLLPFIDEKRLIDAELTFCSEKALSAREIRRNVFGKRHRYTFDPHNNETIPSCNEAMGLQDINNCQTSVQHLDVNLLPGIPFRCEILPGTNMKLPGFPSLGILPMDPLGISIQAIKLNVFGSESKYKSILLSLVQRNFDPNLLNVKALLGRNVFVNFPLLHEAQIVEISSESKKWKLRVLDSNNTVVEETCNDAIAAQQWRRVSTLEETKYLKGRAVPGTGGLNIGAVQLRLGVVALQGMRRDRVTGALTKVFGTTVSDLPAQLALWDTPYVDHRFVEEEEMSLESFYPFNSTVVATSGPFIGCIGRVIGPHKEGDELIKRPNISVGAKKKERTVDVEFTIPQPPEIPFGYIINQNIQEDYLYSRDICKKLNMSSGLFGQLVGNLTIEVGSRYEDMKYDIGLNLKKGGSYQLLGYAKLVGNNTKSAWSGTTDTVLLLSAEGDENVDNENGTKERFEYMYSRKTLNLISEYKTTFPKLFERLEELGYNRKYLLRDIFGPQGLDEIEKVLKWLKGQQFFNLPRSPVSTESMAREAVKTIEQFLDDRNSMTSLKLEQRKNVPVQGLFRSNTHKATDAPLLINESNKPVLGDRIVNIAAVGVPFGIRGTVIVIHPSTSYVEVLFDEEFAGGKSLQGLCSDYRGGLVSWSAVIRISKSLSKNELQEASNRFKVAHPAYSTSINQDLAEKREKSTYISNEKKDVSKADNLSSLIAGGSDVSVSNASSAMGGFRILKKAPEPTPIKKFAPAEENLYDKLERIRLQETDLVSPAEETGSAVVISSQDVNSVIEVIVNPNNNDDDHQIEIVKQNTTETNILVRLSKARDASLLSKAEKDTPVETVLQKSKETKDVPKVAETNILVRLANAKQASSRNNQVDVVEVTKTGVTVVTEVETPTKNESNNSATIVRKTEMSVLEKAREKMKNRLLGAVGAGAVLDDKVSQAGVVASTAPGAGASVDVKMNEVEVAPVQLKVTSSDGVVSDERPCIKEEDSAPKPKLSMVPSRVLLKRAKI